MAYLSRVFFIPLNQNQQPLSFIYKTTTTTITNNITTTTTTTTTTITTTTTTLPPCSLLTECPRGSVLACINNQPYFIIPDITERMVSMRQPDLDIIIIGTIIISKDRLNDGGVCLLN